MNYTVHTKGHSELVIQVVLVVLAHLVVVFIFFSLFPPSDSSLAP
jgi:hypothetical protein